MREMEESYEPLKELGAGNFGVARLVRHKKTKELLAIKYIERGRRVNSKKNSSHIYILFFDLPSTVFGSD